jgi:hypothetical protein
MPAAGYKPFDAELQARRDKAPGPENDEPAGRAVYEDAVLRGPQDEKAFAYKGV